MGEVASPHRGATFTEADLAVTRGALSKGRARAFETAGAKLGVLEAIGDYGLPTEPYVFVVDAAGNVFAKFEGIAAADELEAALESVATDG